MAGAGYKLFNTGDVLTAAQVNTYLQEQVVMVFNDAAARTTALSGVLAEGMVSYLKSTDAVEIYNGSAWVGIAADQTPLTTKGDLFTYSTTDARLAVGNNGETLVADSSTSTGLRYNPISAAGKNVLIGGGFDVWQRGTSFSLAASTGATYVADRWVTGTSANQACTISRQATGDTTNLPNLQYCLRYQRNSGQTGTSQLFIFNNVETVNSIPYAGQPVTLSFWARRGADFSAASYNITGRVFSGTGTDQNRFNGSFTGDATVASASFALTTTWQKFTVTGTVGATATQLAVGFWFTPVGTAGTNDYYEIAGVQLELGSVATAFNRAGGTLAGELAACQRYYTRFNASSTYTVTQFGMGIAYSTTNIVTNHRLPVTMRTVPTALDYGNLALWDVTNTLTISSAGLSYVGADYAGVNFTTSSAVQYRVYNVISNSSASGYIGFSAEL